MVNMSSQCFLLPHPKTNKQKKLYMAYKDTIETKSSMPLILWENTEHLSDSTTKILFTWWLASLWLCLSGLKKRCCSLCPPGSLTAVSTYAQSWFGEWEKRESEEKAELSTDSAESSCSHTLPSVFLTHRYFPLLSIVSKKINGGLGAQETKRVEPEADSFCLPHLRREAPSGFLLQRQGIRWDPSGSNSICFSRKSSFRQRAQDPPAAELNTGALSMFPITDFTEEERGLWLHSWERLLLQTFHTAVVKTHKRL